MFFWRLLYNLLIDATMLKEWALNTVNEIEWMENDKSWRTIRVDDDN